MDESEQPLGTARQEYSGRMLFLEVVVLSSVFSYSHKNEIRDISYSCLVWYTGRILDTELLLLSLLQIALCV